MRRTLLFGTLVLSAMWLGGCIVIISEEKRYPNEPDEICVPANATIEEIDAVTKLAFESSRRGAYRRIAERQGLSDPAQAHLVQAVFDNLSLESSREEILLTLIKNPSFSCTGRTAILAHLEQLALESTKQRMLKAMSDCAPCAD